MIDPDNEFSRMQREFYAAEAAKWSPDDRDPVVGAWAAHEAHADYDLLFDGIDTAGMVALDFGCGPGRMMARYADRFTRIDGADIDRQNLVNAGRWLSLHDLAAVLWYVNGVDLADVPDSFYDLVFSTICLQHIPVHAIRQNLFREFFRVLKPGGWFTAQMGFGDTGNPGDAAYHEDKWDAGATNGGCDVKVLRVADLQRDLKDAGFEYDSVLARLRPAGPNDRHPDWVFFRARKPL